MPSCCRCITLRFSASAAASLATRLTASCPACVAIRRKRKVVTPHSMVWGKCIQAMPPLLSSGQDDDDVFKDLSTLPVDDPAELSEGDNLVALCRGPPVALSPTDLAKSHPHCCMAMSDMAAYGS